MLTQRQARVLELTTEHYIHSAHPVASAQLAKRLQVSSATIRNELASLEEAGYLHQAHTSAGRTPTLLGYQRYAQRFIPPQDLPEAQRHLLEQQLQAQGGKHLWQSLADAVASLSGYAVLVTLPAEQNLHTVHVHLSLLSDARLLAVVVLENGLIRQIFAPLSPPIPSAKELEQASQDLHDLALPIADIPAALSQRAQHAELGVRRTLQALLEAWQQLSPPTVFAQGLSNLLAEPESQDPVFLRQVLQRMEAPSSTSNNSNTETEADILQWDSEDARFALRLEQQLALVSSHFQLGRAMGSLTLIGPLRMRYPQALMLARAVQELPQ